MKHFSHSSWPRRWPFPPLTRKPPPAPRPATTTPSSASRPSASGPATPPRPRATPATTSPRSPSSSPAQGTANGSAVIIFPGGAYAHLAGDLEGREVADWFTARGFRAFILSYRLSSHGYLLPVPLLDARRAIQTVRARARDYHIDPNRIVVIGFSAGGHLAALAGTAVRPRQPRRRRPHRPRLQPPRLPRPRLSRGSAPSPATPRT